MPHLLLRPLSATVLAAVVAATALPAPLAAEEANRDDAFAALFEGKRLEGNFNVVGADGLSVPYDELYMVSDLERGEGDTWIFTASMKYGDNAPAAEFPIPVQVLWAGETPVITMTEQTVEGLGTFTVRLLLHGDRYAGTWQHGQFGGHMWGMLVDAADGGQEGSN